MTATFAPYFRRRIIGRAASPPTWACYEQIPYEDGEYSDSTSEDNSCSEDGEDYAAAAAADDDLSDEDEDDEEDQEHVVPTTTTTTTNTTTTAPSGDDDHAHSMQIDESPEDDGALRKSAEMKKDVKGKQRALQPEPEPEPETSPKRRHRKKRQHVYTLRPILTIQKSQGFVWNQDLFVPPYIKDRYVASTSPPQPTGFMSTSASSTNSALTDYEVEVVEIRVQEGDLDSIIP